MEAQRRDEYKKDVGDLQAVKLDQLNFGIFMAFSLIASEMLNLLNHEKTHLGSIIPLSTVCATFQSYLSSPAQTYSQLSTSAADVGSKQVFAVISGRPPF